MQTTSAVRLAGTREIWDFELFLGIGPTVQQNSFRCRLAVLTSNLPCVRGDDDGTINTFLKLNVVVTVLASGESDEPLSPPLSTPHSLPQNSTEPRHELLRVLPKPRPLPPRFNISLTNQSLCTP